MIDGPVCGRADGIDALEPTTRVQAIRRLASLGALTAAALACAWAGAAPAGATTLFDATTLPATVSGEQTESHVLSAEGLKVTCKHVTFSGELSEPSETLTLTPTYSECTAAFVSATVEAHGCQYVFHAGSETAETKFTGLTDISCPTGQSITITALSKTCEAKIGTQSSLPHVIYTDEREASPVDIKAEETLSEVHYTVSKDEGLCPFSGTGEKSNGSLTGSSLLKAAHEAAATGLAIGALAPTQLCQAAPEPSGACGAGKAYKAPQTVQATSPLPKGDTPQLFVLDKNAAKKKIDCTGATISFKTKEDIANPLDIESYTLGFTGCEIKTDKVQCTVKMENAGAAGTLDAAAGLRAGVGVIKVSVNLKVECGTVIEQCEYKSAAGKPDEVRFRGGSPAEMYSLAKPIPFSAGKAGCFTEIQWFGDFEVTQPKAVWVTN